MQTSVVAQPPSCFFTVRAAAINRKPPKLKSPNKDSNKKPPPAVPTQGFGGKKKDPVWQCVQNCGACCKLDKGPTFPSPEEIFEDPSDVEVLYFTSISPILPLIGFVERLIYLLCAQFSMCYENECTCCEILGIVPIYSNVTYSFQLRSKIRSLMRLPCPYILF